MREVQEEFGEDDEEEDEDFEMIEMSGQQNDEDEGSERDDENDAESEDEDDEPIQSEPTKKKGYLPEHLFASAFSQLSSEDEPKAKARSKKRAASPPTKRRKRVKTTMKGIVVGSRVVRTLPSLADCPSTRTPKGLAPPRALNKFIGRRLNARGHAKDAKLRGWERRPANVGVVKRNGPAAHFVRDD
ncbi:uncharacterized protein PHACADRAFT_259121 [Phanerochaete carnosa HHB-10118-sp]|uniref:Uncharacterized protein n=1 Tax=Phanerochaete carnosa (strain HHB-10118-sp) TaxID=650164 RepID=K5W1H2_PHACS|nr:uncharacterized protein PHACADRAFT_259121 [Phanerochaete carnosa HHB-10118-sp]EKM52955.1 hypothetical protein PHACADRAFT_259121 [Phanerochaete carnosa HHB-10118-sp]